ncbi:MAG: chitobiase/beta-hexosaminidase C-terminal domain-containing protein, partial [Alloprevotella sp.]|nr:chitobiase/beta-hexosaminidase C-terminal domain-containing protein [Alloprevotella sp.]
MRNLYSFRTFLLAALVSLLGGTALAQTQVTDELTASDFAATNTTYTDFSGVSKTSEAVYAGNSAKTKEGAIQMRSKNSNSGIVSTVSGGTVKSVKITVASGSNTVDVYGSNTAYTSAGDLYATTDNVTQGTLLGSLAASGTITVQGSYKYIGIRSNNGAIYLSSVEVTWEQAASGDNRLDAILTFPQQSLTFDQGSDEARNFEGQEATLRSVSGAPIEGVSIAYSVSAEPEGMVVMDDESYFLLLDETLAGKATVTATFAGDNTYKPATASYTITIQPAVADIAAFNALAKGTKAKLTLTDAEVVYAQGNDIFVRDASGAIDFFRTDLGYSTGDILNGTLVATHDIYNGMSELTSPEDVSVTAAGGTAAPEARDATVATASSYTCDLITLSEVDVIKDGNNFYATDGENRVQVYDKFRLGYTVEDGKVYNIKGILIPFNNIYEICPVQAPEEVIQVETPVIAPEDESGRPGLEVSISVENEDLTIYYTLDGTDPAGQTGIEYEGPFLLTKEGAWFVKAVAVDEDGNVGEVAEKTYYISAVFETPEITPQREQIFTGTQISISGTSETQDVYYTTDGSTPDPDATPAVGTLYEGPFTLEAGQHTVKAKAVDKYGNVDEFTASWDYFVEERKEAGIAWEQDHVQAEPDGGTVVNMFVNPNQLEVTFYSSDPDVARVDNAGFVYAGTKEGEATITAIFAGTEEYDAAVASFTLTVVKATVPAIDAPDIDPAGGEISENASITISWNGDGGAYILYTTDGSDPKASQTVTKRLMGVTLNVADLVADGRETLTVKAYAQGIPQ